MIFRHLPLIFLMSIIGQLQGQSPDSPYALYAKRLVTNFDTDLATDSPLDFENYKGGFELAYGQNIGKNVNVVFPFKTTVFRMPEATSNDRYFSLGGQLHLHYKLGSAFSPYILGGAGVIMLPGQDADAQIPLGAGINFRINKNIGVNVQTEYRISIDGEFNHYQHGIGMYFNFGGSPQDSLPVEIVEVPPADRDMDGIVDSLDNCPDIAGLAAFSGCPDSDNDGISDQSDACPDLAGPREFNGCPDTDGDGFSDIDDDCPDTPGKLKGCPPADRDGDGVADEEDDCPDQKGTLRGCPDLDGDGTADSKDLCPTVAGPLNTSGCPDSDDDGLDDSKDQCPNKAGPLSNRGCPEISANDRATLEFAMQSVNFHSGSDKLTSDSHYVLNQVAEIMAKYPPYNLSIEGHTDSIGGAENNLKLSEDRAKACKNYLYRKGIDGSRMSTVGYGSNKPIADNATKEGRRANRRVEFKMNLK